MREPAVSGRFYPDDPTELSETIRQCYGHRLGVGEHHHEQAGRLAGMIVPHAGYVFSGPVASWGYQRLADEKPRPRRLLMLGPKHTRYGAPAALSNEETWLTPLGSIETDETLRAALEQTGVFSRDNAAHTHEHSLEVQIPFVQHVMHGALPKIVPLALAFAEFDQCLRWGRAIAGVLAKPEFADTVCVISSDFSHETPRAEAYRLDGEALDVILSLDAKAFHDLVVGEDRSICGVIPITVFLAALSGRNIRATKLAYATSMDVMAHPRGVGYAAVVFENI